jgi:hypothetical protein
MRETMLQRVITPEQVAPVMPHDLAMHAEEAGIELSVRETIAMVGLLGGTACADAADERIRGDIALAPYRTYKEVELERAQYELSLFNLLQTVRISRRQAITLPESITLPK